MDFTRKRLASIVNYEDFFVLRQALAKHNPTEVYEFLMPLAISSEQDGANAVAGRALIELEPKCPHDCRTVLSSIATSNWDLSLREVPFYLVSQFGKWNLLREIDALVATAVLPKRERVLVEGVSYWASFPTSELTKPFHYWEWQDVIEGKHA